MLVTSFDVLEVVQLFGVEETLTRIRIIPFLTFCLISWDLGYLWKGAY